MGIFVGFSSFPSLNILRIFTFKLFNPSIQINFYKANLNQMKQPILLLALILTMHLVHGIRLHHFNSHLVDGSGKDVKSSTSTTKNADGSTTTTTVTTTEKTEVVHPGQTAPTSTGSSSTTSG